MLMLHGLRLHGLRLDRLSRDVLRPGMGCGWIGLSRGCAEAEWAEDLWAEAEWAKGWMGYSRTC